MTKLFKHLFIFVFVLSCNAYAQEFVEEAVGQGIEPIRIISSREVILSVGNIQRIKTGENGDSILNIEFFQLDPVEKFPIVKIQGIPFKITQRDENIKFTWQNANYTLVWMETGDKVSLISSEPFGERTFSAKAKQVKSELIYKGLSIETKRLSGEVARLDITGVRSNKDGEMEKFSLKTFSDTRNMDNYQNENDLVAPRVKEQIEKGINGEVLFIFAADEKGEIYVYYR